MPKKSPSVTAAERIGLLTKPPYKRQKKSDVPVPAPQAEASAAVPGPVPLVTTDNVVARAPAEKKSPPVLQAALLARARSMRFAARCCRRTLWCASERFS